MIGIAIVLTVLIVIIAVLIIHANNKHSDSGIFRNGVGGGVGYPFLKTFTYGL